CETVVLVRALSALRDPLSGMRSASCACATLDVGPPLLPMFLGRRVHTIQHRHSGGLAPVTTQEQREDRAIRGGSDSNAV
ncbi:MAG TPA: hypothetical protein VIW46_04665, partial [Acidimicrobiia bacterium]